MHDYVQLIKRDTHKIAAILTREHGKTIGESKGDTFRGQEFVESSCGASHILTGETIENISKGIDCYSFRKPLGVCAGIVAYNSPVMIALWLFPIAITCGNTYILKPSRKTPESV